MMQGLIKTLHEGGYTLVVSCGDDMRVFVRRGVADLLGLLTNEPEFLRGALVADKVVGKAAAALMIKGGVDRLHADVISVPAVKLLEKHAVPFEYEEVVDYVKNRDGSSWCPLERLCFAEDSVEVMVDAITDFVDQLKVENK